MKFGSFYELEIPRPWEPGKEQRIFRRPQQVELGDRLGFYHVWATEHHFLEEYAHSSAPEVFLAACSQRIKRIRLGHGVTLLPLPYNHPARVAEQIATLDQVSNGRVGVRYRRVILGSRNKEPKLFHLGPSGCLASTLDLPYKISTMFRD